MGTSSISWLSRLLRQLISLFDKRKVYYCFIGDPPDGSHGPTTGPLPGPGPRRIGFLTPEKNCPQNLTAITLNLVGLVEEFDQLEQDREIVIVFREKVKIDYVAWKVADSK